MVDVVGDRGDSMSLVVDGVGAGSSEGDIEDKGAKRVRDTCGRVHKVEEYMAQTNVKRSRCIPTLLVALK